ncbi:hypothetical protein CLAFUR0_07663 [Fulvia fulva]|nr:hypothetical protein CLAFUR0_07663 [Fulvia fulva]
METLSQGSNFETWKLHMDATLRAKDLDDFQYCHAQRVKFKDDEHEDAKARDLKIQREALSEAECKLDPEAIDYAARLREVMLERRRCDALLRHRKARPSTAARTLLKAVAASLTQGISQDDMNKPFALWKVLEQQSKPFRFLDLPAEMQNRISAHTLANGSQSIEAAQPGITRVNRQIREQTLPMYYTSTTFHIHPRKADKSLHGHTKTLGSATETMVTQWVERSVGENAKYLRRAILHLDYQFRAKKQGTGKSAKTDTTGIFSKQVIFDYTEEKGLRVGVDNSCNAKFKIRNQQIAIERQRRMLGLTGNAIVLALVSNVELWNDHGLGWK